MASSFAAINLAIPIFPTSQNRNTSSLNFSSSFLSSPKSLNSYNKGLSLHRQFPSRSVVASAQSNVLRVLQIAWKVGKDGIEAGTDLVPSSIPRPLARIGVAGVLLSISLFVLKSFLSTAFFALGVMGLVYFVFIALNKDEGPRGGGGASTLEDTSLEEARRIMEKYK